MLFVDPIGDEPREEELQRPREKQGRRHQPGDRDEELRDPLGGLHGSMGEEPDGENPADGNDPRAAGRQPGIAVGAENACIALAREQLAQLESYAGHANASA